LTIGDGMVAENSSVRRSLGRGVEDFLEILAKAHVEHLVGLVEHHDAQGRQVERAALEMVAQAARACRRRCAPACARLRRSFDGSIPPTQVAMRAPARGKARSARG
jgi:hypothetical protein